MKPKILVLAGREGSGFENLVNASRERVLDAEIVGVVSPYADSRVAERAKRLNVPFHHFKSPWSAWGYIALSIEFPDHFFALSGWLKPVYCLDPSRTFNIHPGPLPTFGGKGMYGMRVHEAVMAAYRHSVVTHSAVCMHFVTEKYDEGPCFFRQRVPIFDDDTPETLAGRIRQFEHRWQPEVTNLVVHREIMWDGRDPGSLRCPRGYLIVREAEYP